MSDETVICERCGKSVRPAGLRVHQTRWCRGEVGAVVEAPPEAPAAPEPLVDPYGEIEQLLLERERSCAELRIRADWKTPEFKRQIASLYGLDTRILLEALRLLRR